VGTVFTYQVLVPSVENGVEHAFVQKEVAHPLRDDDVDLAVGTKAEVDLFELSLDEVNDYTERSGVGEGAG